MFWWRHWDALRALRDIHNMKKLAKGRWGDTAYLLGGWLGEKKNRALDNWILNLKIVNATIRFAEATERLDNNRWREKRSRLGRLGTAVNFSVSASLSSPPLHRLSTFGTTTSNKNAPRSQSTSIIHTKVNCKKSGGAPAGPRGNSFVAHRIHPFTSKAISILM